MATSDQIASEARKQSTFARNQLRRIEDALAKAAGAKAVTIDGVSVTYDDLLKQHQYWQGQVARELGTRPLAARIKLSGL